MGFLINRTISSMLGIWEELVTVNKKGEEVIKKSVNDYETRAGQCLPTMVKPGEADEVPDEIPPLHAKLNALSRFVEIIIRYFTSIHFTF